MEHRTLISSSRTRLNSSSAEGILIESSFSSPTFEVLKRDDEGAVVINAHSNPKFVEDVVRTVLKEVVEKYDYLDDDVEIVIRSESEESIHKHNAFAERTATFGELRNE